MLYLQVLVFVVVVGSCRDLDYKQRIGHHNFECNRLAVVVVAAAAAVAGTVECIDYSLAAGHTADSQPDPVAVHTHIVDCILHIADIADQVETRPRLVGKSWLLVGRCSLDRSG